MAPPWRKVLSLVLEKRGAVCEAVNDIGIMRSVLDRSPDMIALCEMSGRVLYVNEAARQRVKPLSWP
jgi:PAS domain-containing protein